MSDSHQIGPRFDDEARARMQGLEHAQAEAPTALGWAAALLGCAALAWIVPHVDYIVRHTRLGMNLLPASSIFLVFVLALGWNVLLAGQRARLRLTRADLALVFATTMLVNPLVSDGFLGYLASEQLGVSYYARPENEWDRLLLPHLPERLAPRDPADPASEAPRPAAWFFSGLPPGRAIPWSLLLGPYLWWCLALLLVLTMFFALSALLHRQWSDRERLPFPLAQVPELMTAGMGGGERPAFFRDRLAWWGIAATLALHSWNALGDYFPTWPAIDLRNTSFGAKYLTEGWLRHLTPIFVNLYPSVIGIMYLISTEVSFSLWFFYIVVLKLGILVAALGFGLGNNENFFGGQAGESSVFTGQGHGAAFMLALASLWLARGLLGASLKQALGLARAEPHGEGVHPRALWLLLAAGLLGSVLWMVFVAEISWYWALPAALILLASATAVSRIVSEGGVFFLQMGASPAELLGAFFTPVAMGAGNFVRLSVWSRVFVFDWYRSCPMINVIGALHLGSVTNLKRRPLVLGLVAALAIAFAVGFVSFYGMLYRNPGGARPTERWVFESFPRGEFTGMAATVSKIESYERKRLEYGEAGRTMPAAEIPDVARTDRTRFFWMGVGAATMGLFLLLRARVFWWPHPIGYLMWMGLWPIKCMWFTYFLGWAIKALIVKFGGQRVYLKWRNFFVGLIVGEALATALWVFVAFLADHHDGYFMHYD
ncbi:MAG: hypothetical protein M5U26_19990 [Planctomycetota bacterium]|nr:hypothetical protein [Planctomycetota bacterium]